MSTATVRIPEDKRDILKIIASVEKKEIKEILSELIDEYIARHRETLELLSRPEWVRAIKPCRVGTAHLIDFFRSKLMVGRAHPTRLRKSMRRSFI